MPEDMPVAHQTFTPEPTPLSADPDNDPHSPRRRGRPRGKPGSPRGPSRDHTLGGASGLKPLTCTIRETCRLTGLGATSVYKALSEGRLRGTTNGRRRLIYFRSIEQMLGIDSAEA